MATEKWIGGSGVGLTWTACFGTEVNSLPNADAIISSVSITNGTALDMFADVSFVLGSVTTTGAPFLALYLYPLLEDGSTYGDGRFTSAAAGPPPGAYLVGQAGLPVGTQALSGVFRNLTGDPIKIPPGTFKFVLYSSAGVTLAASGNTISYRTYNRQVA